MKLFLSLLKVLDKLVFIFDYVKPFRKKCSSLFTYSTNPFSSPLLILWIYYRICMRKNAIQPKSIYITCRYERQISEKSFGDRFTIKNCLAVECVKHKRRFVGNKMKFYEQTLNIQWFWSKKSETSIIYRKSGQKICKLKFNRTIESINFQYQI